MTSIALKNLFAEKNRFLISVLGVAFAIVLVFLIQGFRLGLYKQMAAFINNSGADIFVGAKGTTTFYGSSSLVRKDLVKEIENIPGVRKVVPLAALANILDLGRGKTAISVIGYDPHAALGAPWKLVDGTAGIRDDEIVFDAVLAGQNGLNMGDRVRIMGEEFRIAGVSAETNSWMGGYVFVTEKAAARLMRNPDLTSFFLVAVDPTASSHTVEDRIRNWLPGLAVIPKDKLSQSDVDLFKELMDPPIIAMVLIAILVGTSVIGLTIYTATLEKIKEYGVLKAIGASNRQLYKIVFSQAFWSAIFGFVLGGVLSQIFFKVIVIIWPQFFLATESGFVIRLFFASLGMSFIAAFVPIFVISKLDPARVFRG